jgi:hypothetical protein
MKIIPDQEVQEKIDALDELRQTIAGSAATGLAEIYARLEELYPIPETVQDGHSNKDFRKSDEQKEGDNTGSNTTSAS